MDLHDTAPPPLIDWAVAGRPLPGWPESGDLHLIKPFTQGVLVAVVDGLGHGPEAAHAARVAVAALEDHAGEPVVALVRHCHEQMRGTRGGVLTLASVSAVDRTMAWLGVGNVEGLLLRADVRATPRREYVVLRGGVVGEQLPPLHSSVLPVRRDDTLILATDGIGHGFTEAINSSAPPQKIADRILATYGKSTDDALVLVVRFVGLAL